MNSFFVPNQDEELLIEKILKFSRAEFSLIRMTQTMLEKSIIDANYKIREILNKEEIIDFDRIEKNQKEFTTTLLVTNTINELKTSFYRPTTKKGDPRFWIYKLNRYVSVNDLLLITAANKQLIIIKIYDFENLSQNMINLFGSNPDETIIKELVDKLKIVSSKGWIKSISPFSSNPRDVGTILETSLGIPINSLKTADYKGEIEIKSKRKGSGTNDSLFSMVPNWQISRIKNASDMILNYGYISKVHEGFYDLYVTVSNKPNNQGLYSFADDSKLLLTQFYRKDYTEIDLCSWKYEDLQLTLEKKHPKTAWVIAEEKVINGEIHFKFVSLSITQKPIFSQFTSLINQGIITFDWRGKVRIDKTGYRDHGHGFRINPINRSKLFGIMDEHDISG